MCSAVDPEQNLKLELTLFVVFALVNTSGVLVNIAQSLWGPSGQSSWLSECWQSADVLKSLCDEAESPAEAEQSVNLFSSHCFLCVGFRIVPEERRCQRTSRGPTQSGGRRSSETVQQYRLHWKKTRQKQRKVFIVWLQAEICRKWTLLMQLLSI